MTSGTDTLDLAALRLSSGEGRRLRLTVAIDALALGGHTYTVTGSGPSGPGELAGPDPDVTLDLSRMVSNGYALHIAFSARLTGPCMRCLEPAAPEFRVEAREVSAPGEAGELESPYVTGATLDLGGWVRDALVLALPPALVCDAECRGLCPACGTNLNLAGEDHQHAADPDPRWAALADLTVIDTGGESTPEKTRPSAGV
ncbi:DUF177 domain-containing protein [Conexibacter sp. DBS9H8]|uniref:YceD family protein n=1 Tax=Conexibacter sp. DBS9H8 TaxID=2937801 RepID=UPI00200D99A3|nr:DUF177 domain-containing protein [Conexibacter sp. DBS9H8]